MVTDPPRTGHWSSAKAAVARNTEEARMQEAAIRPNMTIPLLLIDVIRRRGNLTIIEGGWQGAF
jgi:hypothetical protein